MKKPSKTTKPKAKTAPKKAAPKRTVKAKVAEDVHKFEVAKPAKTKRTPANPRKKKTTAAIDQLGELPRSYGEESIFVVAQEPHWLFCYWDYTLTDDLGGRAFLRHTRQGAKEHEGEVRIPGETNSWYLAVRESDAAYVVELGVYEDGKWQPLTRSSTVLTPRDTLAGLGDPVFANMPLNVTFQQLVEKLRGEMREGENLAEALARLQERGDFPAGKLSGTQRIVLDSLLSTQLGSLTSGDLGKLLTSPGASFFSRGFAPSSWGSAPGASWAEAPGGVSSGFLALFGLPGASWSSGAGSSALTSWSGFAPSSWGAESSWGLGASWSAQPFSQPPPRGFFLHVNAEVIFYGGTHPDAKVTIDGREIGLRPDGSFRSHFVFPDGTYEIPIVVTSPDGQEVRRAFLRFERATGREGEVGTTDQPPLAAPMGRQG
jgi:hypothetical protein